MIMGTIALAIITIQIILGITSNVMKNFKNSSTTGIYFLNTCHKYLGYASVIYIKVQTYLTIETGGLHPTLWKVLLGVDVLFLIAFIVQKMWFPTFASEIMPDYSGLNCKTVSSIKELRRDES